ncbi:hypothetical protein Mgra_00009729 [Meloidogyne graminicola]|uniref:Uncharacterized protein n=1 Tax=Meloidogyne graminicola TaxID=189291 RepID=A0A8S9ZD89_9BILA|nr:hypothetical protein Mgra_00009729 [Meloidogyne graminicola]
MSINNTSNNSLTWSNIDYFPSKNNENSSQNGTDSLKLNLTKINKQLKNNETCPNNQSQWMQNILFNQLIDNETTKSEELRLFWEKRINAENIQRKVKL